ncbi:hypothetical protein DFH09DRAFT_1479597 [Mycena vulgaris]|nr:hypothetical protein DFH09DRAFT_1479597 [Mycena vulgaris]
MATGPTFTGNGTSAAIDFIKDVRLGFRGGTANDAEKLEEVGDRFRHGLPADVWFRASTFTTWAAFTRAFEERFAGMAPMVKPRPQLLAELAGMRITIEHLVVDHILVGGEKISPMVEFRSRLREAVLDASAGSSAEGVWAFHAALPVCVRVAVGAVPANWDAMLAALAAVPQTAVDLEVEQHKRSVALEAKAAALEKSLGEMTRVMQSVRLAAGQQQQAPRTTAATTNSPAVNQNAPAGGNQSAAGGGGAGGGGGGLRLRRDPIPVGTDKQRERLRKIMTDGNATQALSNPTGLTLYATQIADWNRANGHIAPESLAIWLTGYPLSPGTAKPCSGECWKCGVCSYPPHKTCSAPLIPVLERKYRVYCGTWFGRLHTPVATMNYVDTVEIEGVPWVQGGSAENGGSQEGFGQGL